MVIDILQNFCITKKEHTHRHNCPFVRSYVLVQILHIPIVRVDERTAPMSSTGFF